MTSLDDITARSPASHRRNLRANKAKMAAGVDVTKWSELKKQTKNAQENIVEVMKQLAVQLELGSRAEILKIAFCWTFFK